MEPCNTPDQHTHRHMFRYAQVAQCKTSSQHYGFGAGGAALARPRLAPRNRTRRYTTAADAHHQLTVWPPHHHTHGAESSCAVLRCTELSPPVCRAELGKPNCGQESRVARASGQRWATAARTVAAMAATISHVSECVGDALRCGCVPRHSEPLDVSGGDRIGWL